MRRRREPESVPAPVIEQMVPDRSGSVRPDVAGQLDEIDRRVLRIASDRPEGSDLNVLALAIHDLIGGIRELHATS